MEKLKDRTNQYTVFAPTDEAYDQYVTDDLKSKLLQEEWDQHRVTWISYHMLSFAFPTSDWVDQTEVVSMSGTILNVTETTVNGLTPAVADIQASNGVLHEMDNVFVHRHISQTIWENSLGKPDYTMVQELTQQDAELFAIATGDGPNTVFIPTDAAFAKAQEQMGGTGVDIMNFPGAIQKILRYHVVPGRNLYASRISPGQTLDTLLANNNDTLTVTGTGVNQANVLISNLLMANGVVHVIDSLLIPPSLIEEILAATDAPTSSPTAMPTKSSDGSSRWHYSYLVMITSFLLTMAMTGAS